MVAINIQTLTVEERESLLERLWDSLQADPEAFPLSDDARAALDARLDDASEASPLDDVMARLRK